MVTQSEKFIAELTGYAEGIPFRRVELADYLQDGSAHCTDFTDFTPDRVRQERTYTNLNRTGSVQRFLAERGVVELLGKEKTTALFLEIHWCIHQLDQLAANPPKTPPAQKKTLVQARGLMSRMDEAEEELFIANRRLIAACVKPFYWIGEVWVADFLQEGAKALTNAIRKFDFTRGTPFYSYAQISVQNRMRNYFRDHIRSGALNLRPTEEMKRMKEMKDRWKEQRGEDPPPEILAKMCGMKLERVIKLAPMMRQWERMPGAPISLDALVGDSTTNMHEMIEDKKGANAAFNSLQHSEMRDAMKQLPERSALILQLRFIEGRTLEDTGQRLDLTRARIKQIQDEALRKLRVILDED